MNTLSSHLLDTYEDRKPQYLPPQGIQSNAQAGPSRSGPNYPARASTSHPNPHAGQNGGGRMNGQVKTEPDTDEWQANHGMPWWLAALMQGQSPREARPQMTPWAEERVAQLQVRLSKRLGPEYVAQRPGPGGGPKLTYIEGWKVINLANEVFGFDGWSSEIRSLHTDYLDVSDQGRCNTCVTAHVRITLRDGTFHEDIGSGTCDNVKGKGAALQKAKKEAVTDAIKRCLRSFGNLLGNCLYDKEFNKEVVKVRVVPQKFDINDCYRRPEYASAPPPPQMIQAGPSTVRPPPAAAPPPAPGPPPQPSRIREGTPLRSIGDTTMDTTIATLDENFDAEFLDDFGDESLLEAMDAGGVDQGGAGNASKPTSGSSSKNGAAAQNTSAPAYQHRHRPDPPAPAPAPPIIEGGVSMGSRTAPGRVSQEGIENRPARSSGGPADTKAKGGFNFPGAAGGAGGASVSDRAAVNASAAAARRQAILAQSAGPAAPMAAPIADFSTPARPAARMGGFAPPIRAESPRIPSGGVDGVAQRATGNFRAQAEKYELQEAGQTMSHAGFSSARGVKRVSDQDMRSPTKQGYVQAGHVMGGQRQALGEITLPSGPGEWDGQKRARM